VTDEDKITHIHDKLNSLHDDFHERLDEFHGQLKDHMDEESEIFERIHTRIGTVEQDNRDIRTIWKFIKGIGLLLAAILTIFWADIRSWFGK